MFYNSEYTLKNDKKLIIRNPIEGDEQGLIDLIKTVDSETKFLAREPGEFNFTLEQEREFIKNSVKNENSGYFVGELDGKIVASCSVSVVMNYKRFLHRAALGIVVERDYWNMGIGRKLMQQCIQWCLDKGIEQLELDVLAENTRAISMYESFGFKTYGTKKNALKYGDGTYGDEHSMILFLGEK